MNGKKKFLKELKSNFLVYGQTEKSYLKQLENQIEDNLSYDLITESYGYPKDLAASFLDERTPVIIKSNIRKKKIMITILVISLILMIFAVCYTLYVFQGAEKSFIDREVVIIEEE